MKLLMIFFKFDTKKQQKAALKTIKEYPEPIVWCNKIKQVLEVQDES